MTRPTDEELARLAELARGATPGPWALLDRGDVLDRWEVSAPSTSRRETLHGGQRITLVSIPLLLGYEPDARYIAATSPDVVGALVAELTEARALLGDIGQRIDEAADGCLVCDVVERPDGGYDHAPNCHLARVLERTR